MGERVGIVSVAQTKYEERKDGLELGELCLEVVEKVMGETGLKFTDDGSGIDSAVTCSQDHWDGRTISGLGVVDIVGGHLREDEKVAEDGSFAFFHGVLEVLSGHKDIVLVVAHTKESHTEPRLIENAGFERNYYRMLGLDFLAASALQAHEYMRESGATPEDCAQVVVKSRANAQRNVYAQETAPLSEADVAESPLMADPIRLLDCKPTSDGACALILATEEKARRITEKPVWLKGMGSCYDTHFHGDHSLVDSEALTSAAKRAYRMAGISDPGQEIDVAEISEFYSYQELLWSEGLGFCDRGQARRVLRSGETQIGGRLPINPSGGLLSGVPVNVAGLSRVAEAALQLRREAGDHQVEAVQTALAHGVSGAFGQLHCVIVLGM
jgi:acetyl-CoA C-acetyltransferase